MSDSDRSTNSILVLGAGELGMAVLRGLTERRGQTGSPDITVLLRPLREAVTGNPEGEQAATLHALGVNIVRADLAAASDDDLATVFAPFPTVVCCTGFVGGPGTQRKVTAAVLKAGVCRYVPWQFGVDYEAVGRGSGQDVWDEQLDVREMLRTQSRTQWTIISTGMFTSFLFEPSFGLVDLENNRSHALGSWDNQLTVTTPEDVGRLVAAILASEPPLSDQVVFVAGETISYRELADTVDRVLFREVDRVLWSVPHLRADLAAHSDDGIRKYRVAFARDSGVAWPKDLTFNAEHGIAVVDVPTWLRAWRDSRAAPGAAGMSVRLSDEAAVRVARPEQVIQPPGSDAPDLLALAGSYYGFWNNGSASLFDATVAQDYIDRTLPLGRAQGFRGLADAAAAFFEAFPDGRVHVLQQLIAADRIVSHLRITGRFLGVRKGSQGKGQRIDYLATDIMRIQNGRVVENWHVEDHDALHRQLA